jgi:hypothetical protein
MAQPEMTNVGGERSLLTINKRLKVGKYELECAHRLRKPRVFQVCTNVLRSEASSLRLMALINFKAHHTCP